MLVLFAVFAAIFSIPFLAQIKFKSKMVKFISGVLALFPAWIWTGVAIWTFGGIGGVQYVGPAVQFTTSAPFSANWLVLLANLAWLAVSVYVVWQLRIEDIFEFGKKKAAVEKAARKTEVDVLADAVKSTKKK
jgi:type VI protein secretion system component VasK